MGQELQIPDCFKGKAMAGAFALALNSQDDNLADGIGQSYGVIGYKGKVWTLRYRGDRKTIVRPDDGTPSGHLDVIILGQAKSKSKSFYKAYDANTSDGDRPICSSVDSVVPDADVQIKQCDSCVICPRNVWKTDATTGRKGRECTDYKRLAVLILPTQTKPIMGTPLLEPLFLRVPPDSLNSLAMMGETMAHQGYHYASYVTRITFDPAKAHPCMVFRPLQGLSDGEAPLILELRADPTVGRITGGEAGTVGRAAVQLALQPAGSVATGLGAAAITATTAPTAQVQKQPVTQHTQQQVVQVQPAQSSSGPAAASILDTGLGLGGDAQPATQTQNTSAIVHSPGATGLTGLTSTGANTASGSQNQPLPGLQTVADVGAAEASDDELDARIAGLMSRQ